MRTPEQRARYNATARAKAAATAIAEGRVPGKQGHPADTDAARREKRRLRSTAWRTANVDRAREIGRESERRRNASKAIAAGREPGLGPQKRFSEEERRFKRQAKTERWNELNRDKYLAAAREREQAKRDGTFVSRALPRLTDEQKKTRDKAHAANRRALKAKSGGKWNTSDIALLLEEQGGKCGLCFSAFGDDGFHVDHFMPLALGGSNDPSNLQLLHPTCNLKKGARHPAELGLPLAHSAARS